MKTIILLIDFYGHPALTTDSYSDSMRYAYLNEIISSGADRNRCLFFSTVIHPNDKKLRELKNMAISKGFKFFTLEDDPTWTKPLDKFKDDYYTIDYVKSKLGPHDGNYISHLNTQIIVTGTNTSGCVFTGKPIGALHWYKEKYKTKIYLPMCAEYENNGRNDFEKNQIGFASLYKQIYDNKCFDIEICRNLNDLNLPL